MSRFCSIFSQLLQLFSRIEFQQAVKETQAERHARGFTCWGQFVAMLFCQLGRAHSLREITGGLRSCEGKLRHLGITAPIVPPWPMPMNIGHGNCIKRFFSNCSNAVGCRVERGGSFGLRTNWSVWIPPRLICA